MRERRKHPRISVSQPAALFDDDGTPIADCLLRDISIGGARLRVEAVVEVPEKFNLQVPRGGKVQRHCEIVWKSNVEMGVRFVDAARGAADPSATHQSAVAHEIALL